MSFNKQVNETVELARKRLLSRISNFETDAENQKALDELEQIAKHQGYWLSEHGQRIEVINKNGIKDFAWHPESIKQAVEAVKAGYRHE